MTKNYFIQLADYNIWANNIVHSWFENITDEQWRQPVTSSFESIGETALHVAGAENIWSDRLNQVPAPVWLPTEFKGKKKEILDVWKKASEKLKLFMQNFDESKLQINLKFKRLNGTEYEIPHFQVLAHIFNHSTYHRGQLVTLLRQVGFTEIFSTDLLAYYQKQNN